IYAVDSSFTVLWRSLSHAKREEISRKTDEQARKAAEHNAIRLPSFDVATNPAFAGYVRRSKDGQPYRHWSEVMLAGVFQEHFFQAIGWVRGQLVHAATSAPMDLRQYRAGAEPRWKWRESADWARGRVDDAGRRTYDQVLATHDVVGLLGHLTSLFVEARYLLPRSAR